METLVDNGRYFLQMPNGEFAGVVGTRGLVPLRFLREEQAREFMSIEGENGLRDNIGVDAEDLFPTWVPVGDTIILYNGLTTNGVLT